MINHIEIDFNDDPGSLVIGHNDQILFAEISNRHLSIDIDCPVCDSMVFWIDNRGERDIEINNLSMFGHGSDKLKFLGRWSSNDGSNTFSSHWVHSMGRWQLEYQYPTFSWLHQQLHYGWLVKGVGR